jgi:hypothetical protein
MKAKALLGVIAGLNLAAFLGAVGCGGDSSNAGGGTGVGVVSCDILQLGLHYCEEAPGSPGANTGCPTMMTGFTPGTGCSRAGLSATCTSGNYTFFLYTTGVAASTLAGICPGGTFEPVSGSTSVGAGGATSSSTTGSCSELAACCNSSSNATLKSSCLQVYTTAMQSGDKGCAGYLPLYKLALNCQ